MEDADVLEPTAIVEEIVTTTEVAGKKTNEKSNSRFFSHLLDVLHKGKYNHTIHFLPDSDNKEFEVIYINKNSRLWERKYISLFEDMDGYTENTFGRVHSQGKSVEQRCKERFRANMSKCVDGKYIELIKKDETTKGVRVLGYKILKLPQDLCAEGNSSCGEININNGNAVRKMKKNTKKKNNVKEKIKNGITRFSNAKFSHEIMNVSAERNNMSSEIIHPKNKSIVISFDNLEDKNDSHCLCLLSKSQVPAENALAQNISGSMYSSNSPLAEQNLSLDQPLEKSIMPNVVLTGKPIENNTAKFSQSMVPAENALAQNASGSVYSANSSLAEQNSSVDHLLEQSMPNIVLSGRPIENSTAKLSQSMVLAESAFIQNVSGSVHLASNYSAEQNVCDDHHLKWSIMPNIVLTKELIQNITSKVLQSVIPTQNTVAQNTVHLADDPLKVQLIVVNNLPEQLMAFTPNGVPAKRPMKNIASKSKKRKTSQAVIPTQNAVAQNTVHLADDPLKVQLIAVNNLPEQFMAFTPNGVPAKRPMKNIASKSKKRKTSQVPAENALTQNVSGSVYSANSFLPEQSLSLDQPLEESVMPNVILTGRPVENSTAKLYQSMVPAENVLAQNVSDSVYSANGSFAEQSLFLDLPLKESVMPNVVLYGRPIENSTAKLYQSMVPAENVLAQNVSDSVYSTNGSFAEQSLFLDLPLKESVMPNVVLYGRPIENGTAKLYQSMVPAENVLAQNVSDSVYSANGSFAEQSLSLDQPLEESIMSNVVLTGRSIENSTAKLSRSVIESSENALSNNDVSELSEVLLNELSDEARPTREVSLNYMFYSDPMKSEYSLELDSVNWKEESWNFSNLFGKDDDFLEDWCNEYLKFQ